jgi:hypothetical protein
MHQGQLAAEHYVSSAQRISKLERGEAIPQLDELVRLHTALSDANGDHRASSLLRWIATWVEEHQRLRAAGLSAEHQEQLAAALHLLHEVLPEPRTPVRGPVQSLVDFPQAFQPLQIICGDRREVAENRRSLADLFILSAAITDVTFLTGMDPGRQAARLWSDKLLVLMEDDFLKKALGHSNLLVIGSPAVNWAARILNWSALFRFDIERRWHTFDKQYRSQTELKDSRVLRSFWGIVRIVEDSKGRPDMKRARRASAEAGEEPAIFDLALKIAEGLLSQGGKWAQPKYVTNQFRKTGIVDPSTQEVRGIFTIANTDFGVISLAPNPFADPDDRYVSILVGGIHGPGTAHALRMLLQKPEKFVDRPFGGVIDVRLRNPYSDWPTRFYEAEPHWDTPAYTPNELLQQFERARTHIEPDGWMSRYTESELVDCCALISRLTR